MALNTIGPFYRFGVPILRAAIETGTTYLDVCDDVEPTLEILQHDRLARSTGGRAIIGMGASPGVTNLAAKELVQQLDETEEIITAWAEGGGDPGDFGPAVIEHTFHIVTGRAITFRNGRQVRIRPYRERVVVPFPPPIGPLRIGHVAHPEPLTLPYAVPGLRTCSNLGGHLPMSDMRLILLLGRAIDLHVLLTSAAPPGSCSVWARGNRAAASFARRPAAYTWRPSASAAGSEWRPSSGGPATGRS